MVADISGVNGESGIVHFQESVYKLLLFILTESRKYPFLV